MRIYHTHPSHSAPFNFLNGTEMRIVSNEWDRIGMGATHLEPIPLPSLHLITHSPTRDYFSHFSILQKKTLIPKYEISRNPTLNNRFN